MRKCDIMERGGVSGMLGGGLKKQVVETSGRNGDKKKGDPSNESRGRKFNGGGRARASALTHDRPTWRSGEKNELVVVEHWV